MTDSLKSNSSKHFPICWPSINRTAGLVSAILFFKDPLSAHQHAADMEALTRICDVHNVPYATNSASGKCLVTAMASMGLAFANDYDESDTVNEYKAEQQMVIQKVSQTD